MTVAPKKQIYANINRQNARQNALCYEQRFKKTEESFPQLFGDYIARSVHVDALSHAFFVCDRHQMAGISYCMFPKRFNELCRKAFYVLGVQL